MRQRRACPASSRLICDSKSYTNSNDRNANILNTVLSFGIRILDLFRASDFEFRISLSASAESTRLLCAHPVSRP